LKIRRTFFALVLFALLLLSAFAVTADHRTVLSYRESGYTVKDGELFAPRESESTVSPDLTSRYTCTGDIVSVTCDEVYGIPVVIASLPEQSKSGSSVTVTFDFASAQVNLSDVETLVFGLSVRGGGAYGRAFPVTVELITAGGVAHSYQTLEGVASAFEIAKIVTDVSSLDGELITARITVIYNEGKLPNEVRVSYPYLSREKDEGLENAKRYSSSRFVTVGDGSDATLSEDGTAVLFGEQGRASLKADFSTALGNDRQPEYMLIRMSTTGSGTVALNVNYMTAGSFTLHDGAAARLALEPERTEYVFPLKADGRMVSYGLTFSGMSAGDTVRIDSVALVTSETETTDTVGKVSTVERRGDTVRFVGSVEREATRAYSDARIAFYAVGYGEKIADAVEIGSVPLSTQYEYTADLTSCQISLDTCRFAVALVEEDGTVIPLDEPRYPVARADIYEKTPLFGLSGSTVTGAFEANANDLILDVPLDALLDGTDSKTFFAYTVYEDGEIVEKRSVTLSDALLASLDEDVSFSLSAGMKVYLRLLAVEPIDGMTYGGQTASNYALSLQTEEGRQRYAALIRFLSKRYAGVEGFILGTDATRNDCTGTDVSADVDRYLHTLAEAVRLTYQAAGEYLDYPSVSVPMSDYGALSLKTLTVLLDGVLDLEGDMPWNLLYVTDSLEPDMSSPLSAVQEASGWMLGNFSQSVFCRLDELKLYVDYMASVNGEATDENGLALYTAAAVGRWCGGTVGARAVFFDVQMLSFRNDRELYAALKQTSDSAQSVTEAAAGEGATEDWRGSYSLWNFSREYSTLGWNGIGLDLCRSDSSTHEERKDRVLRVESEKTEGTGGNAGIVLCSLGKPTDLSSVDTLVFTLSADGSASDGMVTAVFVIGEDDKRAEYSATLKTDGVQRTYTCDLTAYPYRETVDFVGIELYADRGFTLEMTDVTAKSASYTADEMKARIAPTATEAEAEENRGIVWVSLAVLGVLSAVIFVTLLRRDKEYQMKVKQTKEEKRRR